MEGLQIGGQRGSVGLVAPAAPRYGNIAHQSPAVQGGVALLELETGVVGSHAKRVSLTASTRSLEET